MDGKRWGDEYLGCLQLSSMFFVWFSRNLIEFLYVEGVLLRYCLLLVGLKLSL